ncbi:MAG TPA: proline racemase family protein, partial [Acidimicrobiia bacterium]
VDLDARIDVDGYGAVSYDLAFGGAFYALVDAPGIGLALDDAQGLISAGRAIKAAISASQDIRHPEFSDLGFLYGVIFTGPPRDSGNHSRNVCVFADGEVDRSPTGTGVSARLAALLARDELGVGEDIVVESIVGSTFRGRIVEVREGDPPMIVPEVGGTAHITGRSEFWFDPDDTLGGGFLVR